MTDLNAQDLGVNMWTERYSHVVQDSPSNAGVASSSLDPAVVDVEMPLPNNAAFDDIESDPGFVRNWGRMSAFERENNHPN